eukprot:scaffold686_cov177-Ochromonas_danica.AAC.14
MVLKRISYHLLSSPLPYLRPSGNRKRIINDLYEKQRSLLIERSPAQQRALTTNIPDYEYANIRNCAVRWGGRCGGGCAWNVEWNLLSVGGERGGLTISFDSLTAQKVSLASFVLIRFTSLTRG